MTKMNTILDAIGNTPILELRNLRAKEGLYGHIFAKLEYFNPAGSVKDRVAKRMIEAAEKAGQIDKNTLIIEPTSGNTGIGLCAVTAAKGYRMVVVMPENMSLERRKLMKAYGASLVLTPADQGMVGAIEKAKELAKEEKNSFLPSQFTNHQNPLTHYETTGVEIYEDMEGKIDVFLAGVGTGGTISGVGRYLKEKSPLMQIIAIEPASSPVLSGGTKGSHKIQGIGAGFIPETLDQTVYDRIIKVGDEDAFAMQKRLGSLEGLFVGISSGAAAFAALKLAKEEAYKGKNIVTLFPDGGSRYLSMIDFE